MSAVTRSDVARLLLRFGVGGVMMAHGSQKLFGWFGGGGLAGTASGFESMAFKPGNVNAVIAGVTETGGERSARARFRDAVDGRGRRQHDGGGGRDQCASVDSSRSRAATSTRRSSGCRRPHWASPGRANCRSIS